MLARTERYVRAGIEPQFPKLLMQVRFLSRPPTKKMMFYTYVIKSIHSDYFYKGHCENIEKRLKEHNAGCTVSIKPYIPFELVYYETFDTRDEAIKREKYFKSAAGRRFLKSKMVT